MRDEDKTLIIIIISEILKISEMRNLMVKKIISN